MRIHLGVTAWECYDVACVHGKGVFATRILTWRISYAIRHCSRGYLRAVTRKCRPDWDITTPELKAAWQQGRKELFYPYGKTYVQTLGEQD
ncbi:MAG TPA: hypothetical protein VGY66_05215 [Gemmataceae bacterium]|jgi:hypothetical protein|nr:hypothetical protein [Gemmataceae bacterium]